MTLVDALIESLKNTPGVTNARVAHFAFSDASVAYLSEIEVEELITLLEAWCRERRAEMIVH